MRNVAWGLLHKGLLYLTIIAGFIGSAFLTVHVGPIHIFPYRVLLIIMWLIFVMGVILKGRVKLSQIKIRPYFKFLGLWLFYAILSLAWAASKTDAIRHIILLFMSVSIIYFVVYYFSNDKDIKRLYYVWLFILGCLLLVGHWEHLTGQHLSVSGYSEMRLDSLAPYVVAQVKHTPTGVFTNPNDYASYLTLSIPFVFVLIRYRRSMVERSVGLVALLSTLYLLLMTFSRANYLGVLLELAFAFMFLFKFKEKLMTTILGGLLILALVFTLQGTIKSIGGTISEEIGSIINPSEVTYGSTGIRINLIKNSLIFLARTAGFGVGAGNFEYWMANFRIYDTFGISNPHNWWVEIMVDYGIFIYTGYILFYLGLVIGLYKIHRHLTDRTEKMICEALLVSIVGFFLASISPSSIMAFRPQWFLFAFALAFLNYQRTKRVERAT